MTAAPFPCRRSATRCPPAAWSIPQPVITEIVRIYRAEVERFGFVCYRRARSGSGGPPPPVLFGLALHRRCCRVLALEPVPRAAGAVGRAKALRHDTFKHHLAGMGEDGRAVALDMPIEPDAGSGLDHDRSERGLADLKRVAPQVVAVQRNEVEGEEEYAVVSALVRFWTTSIRNCWTRPRHQSYNREVARRVIPR